MPWMSCGNAHSPHAWGRAAHDAVEEARFTCARALGAEDPSQIIFNSGATEGNNWISLDYGPEFFVSPFEHSSMLVSAKTAGSEVLGNNGYILEPPRWGFASVMLVNNETGAILQPFPGYELHRDITQAVGKIPVDVSNYEYATLSAHKFGGPKGVGIFYAQTPEGLLNFMRGGEQERGLRPGTLNVPGIIGMARALELAVHEQSTFLATLLAMRQAFLDEISDLPGVQLSTSELFSPAIVNLSINGIHGETIVVEMDALGFAISSGAACSSGSTEPSHVLTALGYSPERIQSSIRISFGHSNTEASVRALGRALKQVTTNLRKSLGM